MAASSDRLGGLYYQTPPDCTPEMVSELSNRALDTFVQLVGHLDDKVTLRVGSRAGDDSTFSLEITESLSNPDAPRLCYVDFRLTDWTQGVVYTLESTFDLYIRLLFRELPGADVIDDENKPIIHRYASSHALIDVARFPESVDWFTEDILEQLVAMGLAGGSKSWRWQFSLSRARNALPDLAF